MNGVKGNELIEELGKGEDKYKITYWNKDLIKMSDIISFLTVDVVKCNHHLGSNNGWTLYENKEIRLYINGGILNNVEYLQSIEYGQKLDNPWNDYVNPFYLWKLWNDDGKRFFLDYYREEIAKIQSEKQNVIDMRKRQLNEANKLKSDINTQLEKLSIVNSKK